MSPPLLFLRELRHDTDFHAWAFDQARRIRNLDVPGLDIENVAAEIEGLARRDRGEVATRMTTLMAHLLRWRIQPGGRGEEQRGAIAEERCEIEIILGESPSLRAVLPRMVQQAYRSALNALASEGLIDAANGLCGCEWGAERLLDRHWFPA